MTQPRRRHRIRRGAILAVGAAAGWAWSRARWSPVRVEGGSMMPTLPAGALVAVAPLRRDPERGDVVLLRRDDGSEHIKRIIGVPGEMVALNGMDVTLDAGRYAVAGDDRDRSTDSRHYGPVAGKDIVAVAKLCYWPPRAWRLLTR